MAIYSCNLRSIGRTTHTTGTGGAHIRYIARPSVEPVILARHLPEDADQARNWIDRAERSSRKNARIIDKIRIALPRELDEKERVRLVREFMEDLTGDRKVPWFAAIHQTGEDTHNPHVHIALHDRDIETGKRVLRLSDSTRDRIRAGLPGPKAVHWIRERWEVVCNRALERAGLEVRVDRRTLEEQGVGREPTIHVGPRASHIDGQVMRPVSKERVNGCGRLIDYPGIDKGKTRREFNAHIVDLNLERAVREGNPVRAAWAGFEKDQLERDRALEEKLARERRQRTAQLRNTANAYNNQAGAVRSKARLERQAARQNVQAQFRERRDRLRAAQQSEREALKQRQGRLFSRIMGAIDITGTAKRRREEARKRLSAAHREQRHTLSQQYREALKLGVQAVREWYRKQAAHVQENRQKHLALLQKRHEEADRLADLARQERETDREQMRIVTERKIESWSRGRPAEPPQAGAPQEKGKGKGDDALAAAFRKAQKRGQDHSRSPDSGRGRNR